MEAWNAVPHAYLVSVDRERRIVELEEPAYRFKIQGERRLDLKPGVRVGRLVGALANDEGTLSIAPMRWP